MSVIDDPDLLTLLLQRNEVRERWQNKMPLTLLVDEYTDLGRPVTSW